MIIENLNNRRQHGINEQHHEEIMEPKIKIYAAEYY